MGEVINSKVLGKIKAKSNKLIWPLLVGVAGFEPTTSCSQSRRDTGLRYTPSGIFFIIPFFEGIAKLYFKFIKANFLIKEMSIAILLTIPKY